MKEVKFREKMCAMLETYGAHVSMVESPDTSPGIPDLNYFLREEGWIELKTIEKEEAPKIRPSQRNWVKKRVKAGGIVWLICHQESTDLVYLVPGNCIPNVVSFEDWRKLCVTQVKLENLKDLLFWLTEGMLP